MKRSCRPIIGPAPPERGKEALLLVLADFDPEDRMEMAESLMAESQCGKLSLDGLIEARREGTLVGAIFSQVQVDRTALVWAPRLVSGESTDTAESLLAATVARLARQSVRAAHTLLPVVTARDDAILREAGFLPSANLLYAASCLEVFPQSKPTGPLEFEPYTRANHDRLARMVEATYQQTLDCPGLEDIRQIEDVLAGYRRSGKFSPDQWLIVRHAGQDVGCLILADHPEQANLEMIYMGLVVHARGNAWGARIARYAQWVAHTRGRERLVVAVDASNGPALRAYMSVGFEVWDQRHVYLKRFDSP